MRTETKKFIALYSELMSEWDYSKNIGIDPSKTSFGTSQKVFWRCKLGHEWSAKVNARTSGQGCPYCSGRRVSDLNRLSALYPEICKEWDLDLNKPLTPECISYGSKKKVWWKCANGHSWEAVIKSRTKLKASCPKCPKTYNAKVSVGDSVLERFPAIAAEWDIKKNKSLTPSEVTHSSNKKCWWLCTRGHSWIASPNNRTRHNSGCPKCSVGTSQPEMRIHSELESIFNVIPRWKLKNIELDVYLPELNLGIEFDGYYWHKGKTAKDARKNEFFKKNGIKLIRIREMPLVQLDPDDLLVESGDLTKERLNELLKTLDPYLSKEQKVKVSKYVNASHFLNEHRFNELLSYFPSPPEQTSLAIFNPSLAKAWHPTKNLPLTPSMVSYGSQVKIWWKCENGHEWEQSPHSRNRTPKCSICTELKTRLDLLMPDLASCWHPTKNNGLLPSQVSIGSSRKVWWKCSDKDECEGTVSSRCAGHRCLTCPSKERVNENYRVSNIQELMQFWDSDRNEDLNPFFLTHGSRILASWKCPKGHRWTQNVKAMNGKRVCPECSGKRGAISRQLQTLYPELADELHPTKNDRELIENLSYGSKLLVWWRCEQGHEWQARPNARSQGQGCPYCSGKRLSDMNRLSVCNPEISSLWHPVKNRGLSPVNVTFSSNQEVWWQCTNGHEWKTSINQMTSRKTLCTICTGEKRMLSVSHPEIAAQWDHKKNKGLKPSDVTYGSTKKIWWRCDKDHSWIAPVGNRTYNKSGCPYCTQKAIDKSAAKISRK